MTTTVHPPRDPSLANGHPPTLALGGEVAMASGGSEYDFLAELFLGESRAQGPSAPGVPTPSASPAARRPASVDSSSPLIEGLVLGHLPVLASAWVMQYARHVAERRGSWVGVLKLRAGAVSVELAGPPEAPSSPSRAEPSTLKAAIAAGSEVTRHWIVRLDELEEPRLPSMPGIDAVTLLTGADEAAVVASYRTLKQLSLGDESASPQVRVAIMGAEPQIAQEAAARLARAATAFLGHEVELTACVPRIGPGRTISLYRGMYSAGSADLPEAIAMLRTGVSQSPQPLGAAPGPPEAPTAPSPPLALEQRLADLVPGLVPIAARCPYEPDIELASDGAGTLHLLRRTPEGRSGLGALVSTGAWARRHLPLLRLTMSQQGPELRDDPPVLHVFCERGAGVRPLLDAPVRVHVLAKTQVAGQTAWISTEVE